MTRIRPAPDGFAFHYADAAPIARVAPWETVELFTEDCFSGRLTHEDGQPREVAPFPRVNPLTGPIAVEGAMPGDLLAVHFVSVEPARDWGVSTVSPNFGLLSGSRLAPNMQPAQAERVWIWQVDRAAGVVTTRARDGTPLRAWLRPFHGSVGVAPAHGEVRNSVVPDAFGGNLDLPDLAAGTTLYLRVAVPGGKLFVGDGHFAQGDGEIGGTGVEGAMHTTLRIGVVRAADGIDWPRLETDAAIGVIGATRPLEDAVRIATHGLVQWVAGLCGLAGDDALQLVAQCARLRIANLVNPVFTVAAMLEKADLPRKTAIFGGVHGRLR